MAAPVINVSPLAALTGSQLASVIPATAAFLISPSTSLDSFQASLAALSLPGKQTKTIGKVLMTALPNLVAGSAGSDVAAVKASLAALADESGVGAKEDFVKAAMEAVVKLKEFKTRGGQLITYDSTGER